MKRPLAGGERCPQSRRVRSLHARVPRHGRARDAAPAGGGSWAWPITQAIQVGSLPEYHKAWSEAAPRSAEFTMPMDLAGVPAICLPCGFSEDGLPYSIQFTGRRLSESLLCRIAHAYEQATEWHTHHPNPMTG